MIKAYLIMAILMIPSFVDSATSFNTLVQCEVEKYANKTVTVMTNYRNQKNSNGTVRGSTNEGSFGIVPLLPSLTTQNYPVSLKLNSSGQGSIYTLSETGTDYVVTVSAVCKNAENQKALNEGALMGLAGILCAGMLWYAIQSAYTG